MTFIAQGAPPPSTTGTLVYVLGLALTAALGTSGVQYYKFRKQAKREDDSLIATATGEAVAAAKSMLMEYRVELNRAREDLVHQRDRLEKANDRIARLEADLAHATLDRERLQRELTAALERRLAMQQEMNEMMKRMGDLERVVDGMRES